MLLLFIAAIVTIQGINRGNRLGPVANDFLKYSELIGLELGFSLNITVEAQNSKDQLKSNQEQKVMKK